MNELKEKCKVVMLPSEKVAPIWINRSVLYHRYDFQNAQAADCQQLYICSNREIKEGNWCHFEGEIKKALRDIVLFGNSETRKIEASTDKSLGLPSPSKEFIEAYVKEYNLGTPIEECMVEMIELRECECYYTKFCQSTQLEEGEYCRDVQNPTKIGLKINPKDNTISITRVEETWNDLREKAWVEWNKSKGYFDHFNSFFTNWLEQNYLVPKKVKS